MKKKKTKNNNKKMITSLIYRQTGKRLFGSEASHVGGAKEMFQVLVHVGDGRVHRHLVFPLKLGPHLTEFRIRARGRNDVIHDVDVDV